MLPIHYDDHRATKSYFMCLIFQMFDQLPDMGNLQELQKLAKEKGGDFEKLLSETVDEVKKILEEKGKKAKDLAGETTQEAKKQATK